MTESDYYLNGSELHKRLFFGDITGFVFSSNKTALKFPVKCNTLTDEGKRLNTCTEYS